MELIVYWGCGFRVRCSFAMPSGVLHLVTDHDFAWFFILWDSVAILLCLLACLLAYKILSIPKHHVL
jgi:hypothetical protein